MVETKQNLVAERHLRRTAVQHITGLSRSAIYDLMQKGQFPRPVRLTDKAVGWPERYCGMAHIPQKGEVMLSAESLTHSLGGRWFGRYGTLPCPICQPEARPHQNALTLADGTKGLLVHCKKTGCAFRDLAARLGTRPRTVAVPGPSILARRAAERLSAAEKRARQARALWDAAEPIVGSIAETYLRGRGITCVLPNTLRFQPECWHGPTAQRLPAMVARVDGSDGFAVHRTFLLSDGSGKADVPKGTDKMMLGACAGGAVRLANATGRLVVAEGIETALSLPCGFLDEPSTVWAALSASGLRALTLPASAGRLTVACDGDPAGRSAALLLAARSHIGGWQVELLDPGDGRDFNDLCEKG